MVVVCLFISPHRPPPLPFPSIFTPFHHLSSLPPSSPSFSSDVWDPKITTPPGLYLIGAAVLRAVDLLRRLFLGNSIPSLCATTATAAGSSTLPYLRPISAVFNVGSFALLHAIFYRIQRLSNGEALAQALSLSLYPVVFFFGFLYYTDAASLCSVLGMYYLARREKHVAAAALGGVSLMFRQTNVVWVCFVLGTSIVEDLQQAFLKKDYYYQSTPLSVNGANGHPTADSAGTAAYFYGSGTGTGSQFIAPSSNKKQLPDPSEPLSLSLLLRFALYLLNSLPAILRRFWPYLVPLLSFAGFLAWNGGRVVLGDVGHHTPTLHVAQLAYFLLLTAHLHRPLLLLPGYREPAEGDKISALRGFGGWLQQGAGTGGGLLPGLFVLTLAGLVLHRFTLSHPFLLSDNRHYTFYVWQRVFGRYQFVNLLLTPLYAMGGWWLASRVYQGCGASSRSSSLTVLVLGLAVALVLLPAHLLEPRYMTLPIVMTLLEAPPRSHTSLCLTGVGFVYVNFVTVYVFLYRPFTWGDGSVARFMW